MYLFNLILHAVLLLQVLMMFAVKIHLYSCASVVKITLNETRFEAHLVTWIWSCEGGSCSYRSSCCWDELCLFRLSSVCEIVRGRDRKLQQQLFSCWKDFVLVTVRRQDWHQHAKTWRQSVNPRDADVAEETQRHWQRSRKREKVTCFM